jgi:aspartate/methionine/tyrosine aminotransferase
MFQVLDKAKKLEREGKDVCHLELGDPFDPPNNKIIDWVSQALKNNGWHYTSPGGELLLKNQIAELLKDYFSVPVSPDIITIAPANYLITNFLSLTCNSGDTLLLITPCFPSYLASAKMLGIKILEHPTSPANGYNLDESILEKIRIHKPKAIIINSANNPTGAVYSQDVLRKIIVAAKLTNSWILSDETYGLLTYNKVFRTLLHEDYKKLVVLSSFSKIFSIPGLRLGYQVSKNQDFTERSEKYLSTTISCTPAFIQQGCATFLRQKELVREVLSAACNKYANETEKIFTEIPILSQWMKAPQSAFYLFIPLPQGVDGTTFALNLINESLVAVTPGISFGSDFNSFVRVAICGENKKVQKGIRSLVTALEKIK